MAFPPKSVACTRTPRRSPGLPLCPEPDVMEIRAGAPNATLSVRTGINRFSPTNTYNLVVPIRGPICMSQVAMPAASDNVLLMQTALGSLGSLPTVKSKKPEVLTPGITFNTRIPTFATG